MRADDERPTPGTDEVREPSSPDAYDEDPAAAGCDDPSADDEGRAATADATLRFDTLPDAPTCPFCGGTETEQFAAFGSAVSTSQFYCRPCRSVFEFMKWSER